MKNRKLTWILIVLIIIAVAISVWCMKKRYSQHSDGVLVYHTQTMPG